MTLQSLPRDGRTFRCMEIRGGSQAVEESVSTPGFDAWIYSDPFEGSASGGDIHYLSTCGGGTITRVIVADVSGHGDQVAEFSASLRDLMRKNINTKSQTRLVQALNRQFTELAQWRRFATAIVATYLADRRQLTVCNAGHPRPLWYQAKTAQWRLMDEKVGTTGNLPLGFDGETPYAQFTVDLGQDDIVCFYTDALIEAADPDGRMLGEEGLLEIARGLDMSEPRQAGRALLARIGSHRGGRPSDDDTTVIWLVHNAKGPQRLSIPQKLDVYAKVFGLRKY